MMQSILAKFTKTDGGVVVGLFNSVRSFGMVGGSLFAGFIYEFGPKLSFVSSALAFFLSVIFAIVFYNQLKRKSI
jgi:DHA1 family multidrug resistance protein-like MFS transporter